MKNLLKKGHFFRAKEDTLRQFLWQPLAEFMWCVWVVRLAECTLQSYDLAPVSLSVSWVTLVGERWRRNKIQGVWATGDTYHWCLLCGGGTNSNPGCLGGPWSDNTNTSCCLALPLPPCVVYVLLRVLLTSFPARGMVQGQLYWMQPRSRPTSWPHDAQPCTQALPLSGGCACAHH